MKFIKLLTIIILLPMILTGCWDYKLYERTGFILQVGVESINDELLITHTIPVVISGNAKEQTEVTYSNSNTLRGARENSRQISSKIVEGGKLQQLLFSEDIASKGINSYFEIFQRDNTLPSTSYLVIVDGSPRELIDALQKLTDKPLPAFYIDNLIENNIHNGYIPEMRINDFTTKTFSKTIDPVVPVIRLNYEQGKGVSVVGTALFSHDKMVGRIPVEKTPLLLAMMNKFIGGTFISNSFENDFNSSNKKGAAFTLSKLKRKINFTLENNKPVVNISLSFTIRLDEYKFNAIKDLYSKQEIEETVSKEITDICSEILKYCQENGSDPLGIQEIIRAYHNSYYQGIDNWDSTYKDIKFNVKTNVKVNHFGVIK